MEQFHVWTPLSRKLAANKNIKICLKETNALYVSFAQFVIAEVEMVASFLRLSNQHTHRMIVVRLESSMLQFQLPIAPTGLRHKAQG
jgi:hypothetical protein